MKTKISQYLLSKLQIYESSYVGYLMFVCLFRPKNVEEIGAFDASMPVLAPPPKSPVQNSFTDTSPRFNPFDQQAEVMGAIPNQIGALSFGKITNLNNNYLIV